MTSTTASVVTIGTVVLLIAAAILHFTRQRLIGNWLLVAFPVFFCFTAATDLARGPAYLGQGAYESDVKQLAFALMVLIVTALAAFLPRRRWLFAAAWLLNAAVCSFMVYLAFFWKVFS